MERLPPISLIFVQVVSRESFLFSTCSSNRCTRICRSSNSHAFAACSKTRSAARTRLAAAASLSTIISRRVVVAALAACCSRAIACENASRRPFRYASLNSGLHPAHQGLGSDADCPGRFFNVALSKQHNDRLLRLPAKFRSVSCHLGSPEVTHPRNRIALAAGSRDRLEALACRVFKRP